MAKGEGLGLGPEEGSCEDWKEHLESLGLSSVVFDKRAFKAQLAIGEDAFAVLRMRNRVADIWDVFGVGMTGVAVAEAGFVASFFSTGGILGLIGLGTAATPIGWVIAAGTVSGATYWAIKREVLRHAGDLVEVVPKFINAPIDVLALAILDLLIPLALKIAAVDGEVHLAERSRIEQHFVKTWGYNAEVVNFAIRFVEEDLNDFEVKALSRALAEFARREPDCNFDFMIKSIMEFLRGLSEADGQVHENEERALDAVHSAFKEYQGQLFR